MDSGLSTIEPMQSGDKNSESTEARNRSGNQKRGPDNLEQIIKQIPTAVIYTDQYGAPIGYNQSAIKILGLIPANATPSEWPIKLGLYLPDGKSVYPGKSFPLQRALNGETTEPQEIIHLNGRPSDQKWISISAKPIVESDGKIAGAMLFLSDITYQKQIENSLEKKIKLAQAAYTFQRQITEIGNDPLKIVDQLVVIATQNIGDGCIAALLNHRANRLKVLAFHHTDPNTDDIFKTTFISKEYGLDGVIERVMRSGVPLLIPIIDQSHLNEVSQPDQIQYFIKTGVQSVLVVPIKGRNRIIGTISLFRDRGGSSYTLEDQIYLMDLAYRTGLAIDNNFLVNLVQVENSEIRNTQKALEQIELRYQSIFNSTTLGIKLLDLSGNILETNPAFQNMVEYSADQLINKPISTLWHPADKMALEEILAKQRKNSARSYQLEHRLITKAGTIIWVNVTFTRIKDNDGDRASGFIVAIAENITAGKQIEAEMTKMKNRLRSHIEFERLRLAQELHDGPLQDIYSAIFKLENWQKQADPPTQEKIVALKQDLTNLVRGLRSTAKNLRPPALADFGLERAIRSYAEEFNDDHPELTIHLYLAHDGQILPEDVRLILFRVFQHSIMNILRHAKASAVSVSFSFDAEEAQLEIADNGVGFVVPANWVDLVRQGHYGLAGAVERVSIIDGHFSVESKPGEGTIVKVQIPIPENEDIINENDCED